MKQKQRNGSSAIAMMYSAGTALRKKKRMFSLG
jgi:hypothetical protein